MPTLTASNLVRLIANLNRNNAFNYVNPTHPGYIKVIDVVNPEGPIRFKRWNPEEGQSEQAARVVTISREMIWRIANAIEPGQPINFDRILGASYNSRSVFEALLAHTPNFFFCYPGRIAVINNRSTIERGHKHLIWFPNRRHDNNVMAEYETDLVISEIPSREVTYEALVPDPSNEDKTLDIAIQRRHSQIQVALYFIGKQLKYQTWIAQNDKGIIYENKPLGEYDGVVKRLSDLQQLSAYADAQNAAKMIDCIWFKNGRLMPAVMEVEHSTGVTSGLGRMLNFKEKAAPIEGIRWVVVAEDNDRDKVIQEANKDPYRTKLPTQFFPYSAVEELYWLCQKRNLKGVTEEFLDCFMERVN